MTMTSYDRRSASVALRAGAAAPLLFALVLLPTELAAQGQPVSTGMHIPVYLWFLGAGILGLVIAYGIMRNRNRTGSQKAATEQATKNLYREEDRKSGGA